MRTLALRCVAVAASAPPSFGWGEEGHRLILRIAEGLLTPAAQARVKATLNPGESLEDLASWADEVRQSRPETYNWHFVDIPLTGTGLEMARDCPQGNCIIAKISDFETGWVAPTANQASRREALLFLVHFVGDLHQPLHCANQHDRGGNDVPVEFRGSHTNLHALWDVGLFGTMPGEEELLLKLTQAITPAQAAAWSIGATEQWAGESWAAAESAAYGTLPLVANGESVRLDSWYALRAEPVVEQQLAKAGVRLATVLNTKPQ
jgi:nuclease S1